MTCRISHVFWLLDDSLMTPCYDSLMTPLWGYGFLIYNASLVFWSVARPMCWSGWQRHIINEATQVLDALRAVRAAGSGASGGKPTGKGAPGGAAIPVTIDIPWLVELTLNLAFGLEDAGRDADAQKKADEAGQLLDEMMKEPQDPAMAERNTRLRQLVWNARAYFNRKAPGVLGGGWAWSMGSV